jgi:YD repeat-containing protein
MVGQAAAILDPGGHAVDYDESGAVIGMILVNVRFPSRA